MSDKISPEHRSWNMSQIRNRDTKIEIKVRTFLFSKGFRFRKNDKRYPGKPDVVLPKYKTIIFVNGCFWHQHKGCKNATIPKTRTEFWKNKLINNVRSDAKNIQLLKETGWNVITIWECELKTNFDGKMNEIIEEIKNNLRTKEE